MAAPIGNEYYLLRQKDGRDKIFETPEQLCEAANEYFAWCVNNPLIEIDFKGKDATKVEMPRMRVFNMAGLCSFIGIVKNTFYEYAKKEDFKDICTRIKEIIETQQLEGASAGFLNASIIARLNGLAETNKTDITSGGEKIGTFVTTDMNGNKIQDV